MATKVALDYGGNLEDGFRNRVEVWVEGPHAAVGVALDALLNLPVEPDEPLGRIIITPNAEVPKFRPIEDAPATRIDTPGDRTLSEKLADHVKQDGTVAGEVSFVPDRNISQIDIRDGSEFKIVGGGRDLDRVMQALKGTIQYIEQNKLDVNAPVISVIPAADPT